MTSEEKLKQILSYGAKVLCVRRLDIGVETADQVLRTLEGVGVRPGWNAQKRWTREKDMLAEPPEAVVPASVWQAEDEAF